MNKEELSKMKVSELKIIADEKNIDIKGLKKDEIIHLLTKEEEKELKEAIMAGEKALNSLEEARNSFRSASNWGIFDMLGGSTLISLGKHSKIKDGQYKLDKAKDDLYAFEKELKDVEYNISINIDIDNMTYMFDVFFDNFFADFMVQNKINDVIERIDEVIRDVKEVLKVLKEQL